jgi:tol-pal system protein YbgF
MRAARWLAAAALAWAGAAQAQLFTDTEMRRRVDEMRQEMQESNKRIEARMAAIESTAVERRVILDLAGQIEALRAEIARARGQTELILHQLETGEKRQKDFYVDIDTRLRRLEQAREQAAAAPPAPEKPAADAPPTAAEQKVYEAALNQFKLGNYSAAISTLQGLLVTYPESKLAPNAQYWIGMGYSGQRDYKNAIAAHQKVIASWPADPKAADAMLSIASSQEAMGDKAAAQKTLQNVMAKYPGTPAAANAKLRLAQASKR